jgi:hypothetical protein
MSYQDQMALLQEKRRELRALEAQAERTAKNMRPLTEQDERELMELRARADETYRAAGRIGAPEPMSSDRPDTYRLRLAEGLKKHSATWKNADLVNAYAAGALDVAETQIYAEARAAGPTAGLAPGQMKPVDRSDGLHKVIEWVGNGAHFTDHFRRPAPRVVLKTREQCEDMVRTNAMQRVTEIVHRRPVPQPMRTGF